MKALKNKTGLLVFMLLMLVLATMLGFLLTQGRYSEELQSGSDMYDSELEYIVADQVEVSSVEEFIAAVENGYSNITIADDVDDPLIITSGITDVGADLIIDLNGHEIQRNNREPMLNIIEGVRLTVIDSSTSQTGSFYNPVGSVLQIDGGTLTVTAGTFTSGPRSEEYAGTGTYKSVSGGHMESTASLTVRVKSGSGYTESTVAAPIILPSVKKETDGITTRYFVNGNMYFDEAWTAPASGTSYSSGLIKSDTYFYFVIDDDTASNTSIAASENSADFYYTYNVLRNEDADGNVSYSYPVSPESAEGDNVVPVTIYGYHNVKKSSAAGENGVTPDYATVKMMSGNMYTRGGAYESLFGKENTYGIYASGGYMAVSAGAFSAKEAATCVACAYGTDAEASEFLQVTGGFFSSEYGDTVSVSGGNMVLTGGNFTLNASSAPAGVPSAAVSVTGGTLNASNASGLEFDITANALATSVTYGIMVNDGTADIRNATFTFAGGDYTYTGVRGVSVSGGSAALIDTTFTFGGTDTSGSASSTFTDAIGISAEGGSVTATGLKIDINSKLINSKLTGGAPGNQNRGIETSGGTVSLNGDCTINIDGTYSAGILAVTDSSSQIDGETDSIIYGEETAGMLTVNVTGTPPNVTGTANSVLSSTAMSTEGGSINIASGNVLIESDGLGVTTRSGGGITFSGTTFNVDTTNGTGIYVNGGDIKFTSGTVTVNSDVDRSYSWSGVPTASGGYEDRGVVFYDGIVVQGGSLDSTGAELNVTHHGINNNYDGDYSELIINSYAVRVTAGSSGSTDVKITNGELTNDSGGGLYVSGGTVTLGTENSTESDSLSVITSGNTYADNNGRYFQNPDQSNSNSNWNYMKNVNGGNAVDVNGGTITVHYGTYASAFGNGVLVSNNGTANINGGTFAGNDPYNGNDGTPLAGSAASYGLKMYGGTLNVYGGTFGNTKINNVSYDGSGAFITGMVDTAGQVNISATANIYAGTFNATGRIGVSIMRNSEVYFGGDESGANTNMSPTSPTVQGNIGAVAIEAYKSGSYSDVTIYSGTYRGNYGGNSSYNDGIWYGDRTTSLTIISGTFSANNNTARSGLYFDCGSAPASGVVQISGGTFVGGEATHEVHNGYTQGVDYYRDGGAIGCSTSYKREWAWGGWDYVYTGINISMSNIIASGHVARGSNTSANDSAAEEISGSGTVHENAASYQYIVVR